MDVAGDWAKLLQTAEIHDSAPSNRVGARRWNAAGIPAKRKTPGYFSSARKGGGVEQNLVLHTQIQKIGYCCQDAEGGAFAMQHRAVKNAPVPVPDANEINVLASCQPGVATRGQQGCEFRGLLRQPFDKLFGERHRA